MTHLVSFLPAVEAFLRLGTLVNLVAFLTAPPALLGLRAVSGHVAFLENNYQVKISSSVQRDNIKPAYSSCTSQARGSQMQSVPPRNIIIESKEFHLIRLL